MESFVKMTQHLTGTKLFCMSPLHLSIIFPDSDRIFCSKIIAILHFIGWSNNLKQMGLKTFCNDDILAQKLQSCLSTTLVYQVVNIYFDFCVLSYCSMARKFYKTLLEVFKSLIWTVFIPWWIDLDSIELSLLQK